MSQLLKDMQSIYKQVEHFELEGSYGGDDTQLLIDMRSVYKRVEELEKLPSASEMKEVARQALNKECACSTPHKKIRIICDAIYVFIKNKQALSTEQTHK